MTPPDLIEVDVKGLIPAPGGAALFLGDGSKMISMFIDPVVASALVLAMNGETTPRPLTHELMVSCFEGLGVTMQDALIHAFEDETYFARIHLLQENELGRSLLEVDSRPSDALVLALRTGAPVRVVADLWEELEDMTGVFRNMQGEDS